MSNHSENRLYTIGHGDAPFGEIAGFLNQHGVSMVIDVRSVPYSRYAPDFRKSALAASCSAAGFGYRWMGDRLGGDVADQSAVAQQPPELVNALNDVLALNETGPVCLLCSERDPKDCHRSTVLAAELEQLDADVYHIMPNGSARRHQPTLGL